MWEPFQLSPQAHVPGVRLVYDKFHVLRHANDAVDETINGNIRAMLRRGPGYRDPEYLLLKVQRATATRHRHAA